MRVLFSCGMCGNLRKRDMTTQDTLDPHCPHNQLNSTWVTYLLLSVKITAASDAHASFPTHLGGKKKKSWTQQASTLVSRSAASQINQMKCQHVIAVSPAIVAAWTKWHVHQSCWNWRRQTTWNRRLTEEGLLKYLEQYFCSVQVWSQSTLCPHCVDT